MSLPIGFLEQNFYDDTHLEHTCILITRQSYLFNTPYLRRGGPPIHNDHYFGEPWCTHWFSVLFDRAHDAPVVQEILATYRFYVHDRPLSQGFGFYALPSVDYQGYWTSPFIQGIFFRTIVTVLDHDEEDEDEDDEEDNECGAFFRLTDEEEVLLEERRLYNEKELYRHNIFDFLMTSDWLSLHS